MDRQAIFSRILHGGHDVGQGARPDNAQWLECLRQQHGIALQPDPSVPKLEELPMMPPYTVRGGLKQNRASFCGLIRPASGTFTPDLATIPTTTADAPDTVMDFDFDQLDPCNLDLGFMDGGGIDGSGQMQGVDMTGQISLEQTIPTFGAFDMREKDILDGNVMSEHDLQQLSGYMAGFQ